MKRTLHGLSDLAEAGLIDAHSAAALKPVAERYAVAITPDLAALVDRADPADPIARQFVPSLEELVVRPEERADPIGDEPHSPVPGLVHRHRDRVLLKLLLVCPVYCRFCFRRETVGPGSDAVLSSEAVEAALDYVAAHSEIWEVILTGGDPLMLSPRRLDPVMRRLAAIPHVRVLRIHSRVPVAAPARISTGLIDTLRASGKTLYVAVHANHAREITAPARSAFARLAAAGVVLVSQTVLLKGVNDDVEALAALMRAFVEAGVKPYYLHHGDLAPGTSHFRVSLEQGQQLVDDLRRHVSGLCQPTYVVDLPGGYGKVPAAAPALRRAPDGRVLFRDFKGDEHLYPPRP